MAKQKKPITESKTPKGKAALQNEKPTKPLASEKANEPVPGKPLKKAPAKRAAKKTAPVPESRTIIFSVNFYTKYGQSLFVVGNHPKLGNNDVSRALPMHYVNKEFWAAELQLNADEISGGPITYNYVMKDEMGSFITDWGTDKQIDIAAFPHTKIYTRDAWNHAGYPENAFLTEPFKTVFLKDGFRAVKTTAQPKVFDHIFRLKAPLLKAGEVLCMLGSGDALHNWNVNDPIFLSREKESDYWEVKLNLSGPSDLNYKYGIYNTTDKRFVQYEEGDNRHLNGLASAGALTIVNDGFLYLPATAWKGAGVAVPVFSLRSDSGFGIGEFTDMKLLADWAVRCGLKLIQILPVNDTIATHSRQDSYPYSAISAFALNPVYLNLDPLIDGSLKAFYKEYAEKRIELNAKKEVDFDAVVRLKFEFLNRIYKQKKTATFKSKSYQDFFRKNEHWLQPYGLFCYFRDHYGTVDFSKWPQHKKYSKTIFSKLMKDETVADAISFHFFVQYHLHIQLKEATVYARSKNIIVKGDIPIGIYRFSCDAWQQPELYHMEMQAGAPPDDFAVKGQNWGFPTYNWKKMKEDDFEWWRKRFEQMSHYFDAFRIDHILGFFRIWSIPYEAVEGILGYFIPAIAVQEQEFAERNIYFNKERYCEPFINDAVLANLFGDKSALVKQRFLLEQDGLCKLKPAFNTQRKVEAYFEEKTEEDTTLKTGLFDLISNVILIEDRSFPGRYHFRISMEHTDSFNQLDHHTKDGLRTLYTNYFFERQDEFWKEEALQKLPALKRATNMLICGEDLGMVPSTVPDVMQDLGILSLEVQRMPKDARKQFSNPAEAPYLSVVTPSTHDMSTIRGWWKEDRSITQKFYQQSLHSSGPAPADCEPWINEAIVRQHLHSPAMWSIFQLQDLMGTDGAIRRENEEEERINIPADPKHYWRYRMHIGLETLLLKSDFNDRIKNDIHNAGR